MGEAKEKAPKAYSIRVTEKAIRFGDKIFETIDRIEQTPLAFRECEEIPTKKKIYRKAVV